MLTDEEEMVVDEDEEGIGATLEEHNIIVRILDVGREDVGHSNDVIIIDSNKVIDANVQDLP